MLHTKKKVLLKLTDEQIQEILTQTQKPKTGWERVKKGEEYFKNGETQTWKEEERGESLDSTHYEYANYFTSETIAQNILRVQELQRKLWRRNAELCEKVDWKNPEKIKYCIDYNVDENKLCIIFCLSLNEFGQIYFDTKEHAEQVMDEFHDELIWYFTQFKSRMD